MEKEYQPKMDFDLQYVGKVADKYIIRKNDKIKNIYESVFEDIPLL